jgi:hypothetical protein
VNNIILIAFAIFILFIFWVVSIGITYWDTVYRRKLPGSETAAWMALVVLIPGIGFAAYLFGCLLGGFLSSSSPPLDKPRQGTMLKQPPEFEQRTGTIPAAEFMRSNDPAVIPTQMTRSTLEKEMRKFKLTIIAGPHAGVVYLLNYLPVKIGRGPDVTIPLDEDHGVSRLHAEIYEQTGVLRIRDMNSTHGTKVNDFSISDKSLDPGDRIQVGASILMVEVQEEHP